MTLKSSTNRILVTLIALAMIFVVQGSFAQQGDQAGGNQKKTNTSTIADFTLNNFDASEDWRAFATNPLGSTFVRKTIQVGDFVADEALLSDEEKKEFVSGKNNVLGIKTNFKERGFDRVEVKPPHEYIIKGITRQLTVWVLGRMFRHTLYVKLRDYRGKLHKLRLGRLDYLGWRKLSVTIPGWLPQSTRYSLYDKNLRFVSLFVESDKNEVAGEFYFYIDALKVKVDKTDMSYPGSLIRDTW